MKINIEGMESRTYSRINYTREFCIRARDKISRIKEPADFAFPGVTKEWANTLRNIENELKQIKRDLENTVNAFKMAEALNSNLLSEILNLGGTIGSTLGSIYNSTKEKVSDFLNIGETNINQSSASQGSDQAGVNYNTGSTVIGLSPAGAGTTQTVISNGVNKPNINESEASQGTGEAEIGNDTIEKPNINESEAGQGTGEAEVGNDTIQKPNINEGEADQGTTQVDIPDELKGLTTTEFFEKLMEMTGSYGIDIGTLKELQELDPIQYENMKNLLVNEFKLSEADSEELLNLIGTGSNGSYSVGVSEICTYFRENPAEFEEIFGFPLYTQNAEGQVQLNDKELFLDYFLWNNTHGENATLIVINEDGTAVLNKDMLNQLQSVSPESINGYLQSKSENLYCNIKEICSSNGDEFTTDNLEALIKEQLTNEEELSVRLSAQNAENTIPLYDAQTGEVLENVNESQWFKVTGSTEDGIIISGSGNKCIVKYEDILEDSNFTFISEEIYSKTN